MAFFIAIVIFVLTLMLDDRLTKLIHELAKLREVLSLDRDSSEPKAEKELP